MITSEWYSLTCCGTFTQLEREVCTQLQMRMHHSTINNTVQSNGNIEMFNFHAIQSMHIHNSKYYNLQPNTREIGHGGKA